MKRYKIQSTESLEQEMRAVARGERPAPADASLPSFHSVAALMRLLTPENRRLLAAIRDRKPQSIAELSEITGRAAPNLTRTLAKLEAVGFVQMKTVKRRKVPTSVVRRLHVEIDPCSPNDRLELALEDRQDRR
jgi:predicted transcriptional regulator